MDSDNQAVTEAVADVATTIAGEYPNTYRSHSLNKDVVLTKCKVKHTGLVLQLIARIMDEFGIKSLGSMPEVGNDAEFFLKLIANLSDEVFRVAAALTNLSYEEFEELDIDEAIEILVRLYEMNKDFFLQKVLPKIQSVLPDQNQKTNNKQTQTT